MMFNGVRRCKPSNKLELCRMPVLLELFFVLLLSSFERNLHFCLGLNSEGLALLRFKERVARDPFNALSSWNDGGDNADPCSWFGVECSHRKVVALNLKDLCLRGTLTPELGNLAHIRSINLRNNSFYGSIPKEIAELKELEVLDFGFNDLTGPIPFELDNNLSLVTMKIGQRVNFIQWSRRQLQASQPSKNDGKSPTKKGSASSPMPSPAPPSHSPNKSPQGPHPRSTDKPRAAISAPESSLSPTPLPSPMSSPSPLPSPSHKVNSSAPAPTIKKSTASPPERTPVVAPSVSSHSSAEPSAASKSSSKVIWLTIAGGSLVVVVSVIAVIICRSSKVVTVKPWATGLSGQLQRAFVSGVPKLKRAELETACEDFSNIIGNLADSTVYKGTLSSGVEIAVVSSSVKSRQEWSRNLEARFRKKLETLSKVNHKNFVNLIGYCEEEKPFTRKMVFEYAPNGTLFEHLHIKEAERLDWRMRLRMVMGMAYCLEHMHKLNPPIPHRDLQSSSVYISEDYAAKVSDFSFWTEVRSEKMRSPSMQLLEASMADKESNIHSFGILLFEIITGKIPYSSHNGSVEDWVWECLRCDYLPREIIDPTLTTFQEEQIQKLFEIIKDCVHPDPKERPSMREVAMRLMEITGIEPDRATPRISPLWWAELEVLATDAA